MTKPMQPLTIWTIYKHPADYPDLFVARKYIADKPTKQLLLAPNLKEIRQAVQKSTKYELIRVERAECDDSVIIESWL
jgi:hypothetical protein